MKLQKALIMSSKGNLKTQQGQPSGRDIIIILITHCLLYELNLEAL